jgi:anaerobic selenocysteine-containing dehydrogenase
MPGQQWPKGSSYLYSTGFPKGKAKLIVPEKHVTSPETTETHPFFLLQRPSLFQSGLLGGMSENLGMVRGAPRVEVNPDDATKLSLRDGDEARISTADGESIVMKVKISGKLFPGVATVPYPCPLTTETGVSAVKIEKCEQHHLSGAGCP